jgi:hypothetical protein
METVKLTRKNAITHWNRLSTLATNCNVPNDSGWYAITRAHEKMNSAIKPLIEIRQKIEKKYLNRDKSGRSIDELRDGITWEEFDAAIEEFEAGDDIEVEVYKIKISTLKNATMTNMMTGQPVSIPAAILSDIYNVYIIDDFEEAQRKEIENKPEMPHIKPHKHENN